jgi:type IV pilus assembly protein PilC
MRKADELLGNVKRVMAYPSIVGGIILAVSAFLLVYLVPKIIPFVSELGGEIPMHTEALIITSDFVANFWLLIVCVPIVLISVIRMAAKSRPGLKFFIDGALLRIPLFGPMALKVRLARFATYMALLYGAGVTVLRSLEICEDLMDNSNLSKAINEARKKISEGGGISDSFSKIQLFPPLVIRMLRVGETTGNLDDALLNVSYFYEREVQETIETIEPAISPFLTVTMGALLGWIMLSVLGPVWSAAAGIH